MNARWNLSGVWRQGRNSPMAMTLRSVEKITGLEVRRLPGAGMPLFGAYNSEGSAVTVRSGRTEKEALRELVSAVYKINREEAMIRAKFKCENCGSRKDLEAHHKKFRSHGRNDRVENLEVVCRLCHEIKHGVGGSSLG